MFLSQPSTENSYVFSIFLKEWTFDLIGWGWVEEFCTESLFLSRSTFGQRNFLVFRILAFSCASYFFGCLSRANYTIFSTPPRKRVRVGIPNKHEAHTFNNELCHITNQYNIFRRTSIFAILNITSSQYFTNIQPLILCTKLTHFWKRNVNGKY